MVTEERKLTIDEYMQLPIGAPYQYINGCLVDWPSRTFDHQVALGNLCRAFLDYEDNVQNNGMYIVGPIEVILDEQNSFQPDLIYISEERLEIVKDYIYGAPDVVVEVLWEKTAYFDLRPKKDTYEKYGVKEYIIVDPIAQNADLHVLKDGAYYLHKKAQKNEQLNSVLLSGLSFDLAKLFQ